MAGVVAGGVSWRGLYMIVARGRACDDSANLASELHDGDDEGYQRLGDDAQTGRRPGRLRGGHNHTCENGRARVATVDAVWCSQGRACDRAGNSGHAHCGQARVGYLHDAAREAQAQADAHHREAESLALHIGAEQSKQHLAAGVNGQANGDDDDILAALRQPAREKGADEGGHRLAKDGVADPRHVEAVVVKVVGQPTDVLCAAAGFARCVSPDGTAHTHTAHCVGVSGREEQGATCATRLAVPDVQYQECQAVQADQNVLLRRDLAVGSGLAALCVRSTLRGVGLAICPHRPRLSVPSAFGSAYPKHCDLHCAPFLGREAGAVMHERGVMNTTRTCR
eukprot:6213193-Prymnesium_polylepis.1